MSRIYISLGSNIDPADNIRSAVAAMLERFSNLHASPVYRSAAVGMAADDFLNAVVVADTSESAVAVAVTLRAIEDAHGRDRSVSQYSSRTLDLDLLLYDSEVIQHGGLKLPRSDITEYPFVLRPLADLAQDMMHPILNLPFKTLLMQMEAEMAEQFPALRAVDIDLPVTVQARLQ